MHRRTTLPADSRLADRQPPRIMVCDFHQDDPRKCTSQKLQRLHLARPIHRLSRIPPRAIVLNPGSDQVLSFQDRTLIMQHGLVGLDCSWNLIDTILQNRTRGEDRRLPILLAGNPTNYASRGRLSTAEALAAALFITGFEREAERILGVFSWGATFLSLNKQPLKDYSNTPPHQMLEREREYFPTIGA